MIRDEYRQYLELEEADLKGPRRYYTIKMVTRRKNKILRMLNHLLGLEPADVHWDALIRGLARLIAPAGRVDSLAAERRSFKSSHDKSCAPSSCNGFISGTVFQPTPEESEPKALELAGPVGESFGFRRDIKMTGEELRVLAWRLAGNVHKLVEGKAVLPWEPDFQPRECCLARVVDVVEAETFDGDPGFKLTYFFYSGAPAGLEFSRTYQIGYEARLARSFGLAWKTAKLVYPQELVNMTGYVRLEPGRGKDRLPVFRELIVSATHKRHNRQLHEGRLDYDNCPYGFKPEQYTSCMDCLLTYDEVSDPATELRCDFAVRRNHDGARTNAPDAAAG